MSQLELALRAGFSSRHLSFIETGRTQPSRQALLVLAEALDIPLRERNRLLTAGGYAHAYRHTPLSAEEMGHVRSMLTFIVNRHAPYAAIVLDRYANCLMDNGHYARLRAVLVDPSLITERPNHLRMVFHPLGARRFIVNWRQVGQRVWGRVVRELGGAKDDETAGALLDELRGYIDDSLDQPSPASIDPADLVLPIHIRTTEFDLRLFSTIMTLGTPQDVTLQELRIESFFPADESSERTWSTLFAAPT
jgi:transcriptional regulator with XRE-family HTH domain